MHKYDVSTMTDAEAKTEAKAMLKRWCEVQRNKYGNDWKKILADEMTKKTAPFIDALLRLKR